ncbi:SymE family type I addiction module toxin [Endothiovibrio diazotrophicus]
MERRLTVGTLFYEYPPRLNDPPGSHRTRRVPWLQLKGLWLAAAGFEARTPVKVRVMRGCLVVTVAEED